MPNRQYRPISDEFSIKDVGSTLLNHLAKGLYPADEVIREYIQNCIDAHRLWKDASGNDPEGPIQIEVRGDQLSFLDYGIGMFEDEVRRVKSIAVTTKVNMSIPLTGHKGVGIWAGLSYFEKLILQTSRRGSEKGYRLTIHFKRIVDAIDDSADIGQVMENNYFIEEYDEDYDEHYTIVTLEKPVRSSEWFTEVDKVRDAIQRICPCEIDPNFVFYDKVMDWYKQHNFETYPVVVEGQPVYRSFPSSVEHFKTASITVNDVEVAHYWQAIHKKNQKLKKTSDELIGFHLIQSGFALGGTNPYSDTHFQDFKPLNVSTSNYLEWFVGEIHIISDRLRPNLQRNQLEESEEARQFIRKLREFYGKIEEQGRNISEKRKAEEKRTQDIKAELDKYKGYEIQINSILEQNMLTVFKQRDIATLLSIRDALHADDRHADSGTGSKRNDPLKDTGVRNYRKKLINKLDLVLTSVIGMQQASSREKEEFTTGARSQNSQNIDQDVDQNESLLSDADASNSSDHSDTTPLSELVNEATQGNIEQAKQNFSLDSSVVTSDDHIQDRATLSNKVEPNRETSQLSLERDTILDGFGEVGENGTKSEDDSQEDEVDQERVFDTSSHKIPIAVVLGLLEQVLDEELERSNDIKSLIMTKLRERINSVMLNV